MRYNTRMDIYRKCDLAAGDSVTVSRQGRVTACTLRNAGGSGIVEAHELFEGAQVLYDDMHLSTFGAPLARSSLCEQDRSSLFGRSSFINARSAKREAPIRLSDSRPPPRHPPHRRRARRPRGQTLYPLPYPPPCTSPAGEWRIFRRSFG